MKSINILPTPGSNYKRLFNWFKSLDIEPNLTLEKVDLASPTPLILPGVGSFFSQIRWIDSYSYMREVLLARSGLTIGICAGCHVLCKTSDEAPSIDTIGLNVFNCNVSLLTRLHIGFQTIETNPMLHNPPPERQKIVAYFCHSFGVPVLTATVATYSVPMTSNCSPALYSAIIRKHNFCGIQFHPEMSGHYGNLIMKDLINE